MWSDYSPLTQRRGGDRRDVECIQRAFEFHEVGGREVVFQFNGRQISSDGGGLLLGEVEWRFRFIEKFAACFADHRDADSLTHPLVDLPKPTQSA